MNYHLRLQAIAAIPIGYRICRHIRKLNFLNDLSTKMSRSLSYTPEVLRILAATMNEWAWLICTRGTDTEWRVKACPHNHLDLVWLFTYPSILPFSLKRYKVAFHHSILLVRHSFHIIYDHTHFCYQCTSLVVLFAFLESKLYFKP